MYVCISVQIAKVYIVSGLSKHLAIAATGLVGVGLNLHHPIARAGVILHQPIQLQQPAAADSSNWIGWCRFKPTPPSSLVGVGLNLHHPICLYIIISGISLTTTNISVHIFTLPN